MIDSKTLAAHRQTSAATIQRMAAAHAKLMKFIADKKEDGSLNREQREYLVKKEREKMLPSMIEGVNQIRAIAAQTNTQERFWNSKAFVLSQQKYSDSPSSDATIKLWKSRQLASMPTPLLSMTFDDAKASGDFATMALVLEERNSRKLKPGELNSAEFSLNDVELPGRAEALATIKTIETDRKLSENLFSESAGMRSNRMELLAIGRERMEQGGAS